MMDDKDEARWLTCWVPGHYRVYVGKEPQRTRLGYWPLNRRFVSLRLDQCKDIFPKNLRPKPGGPPVKVKVVRG
jgi:hypothetical protein